LDQGFLPVGPTYKYYRKISLKNISTIRKNTEVVGDLSRGKSCEKFANVHAW
jgi:hypothetical protein